MAKGVYLYVVTAKGASGITRSELVQFMVLRGDKDKIKLARVHVAIK